VNICNQSKSLHYKSIRFGFQSIVRMRYKDKFYLISPSSFGSASFSQKLFVRTAFCPKTQSKQLLIRSWPKDEASAVLWLNGFRPNVSRPKRRRAKIFDFRNWFWLFLKVFETVAFAASPFMHFTFVAHTQPHWASMYWPERSAQHTLARTLSAA